MSEEEEEYWRRWSDNCNRPATIFDFLGLWGLFILAAVVMFIIL